MCTETHGRAAARRPTLVETASACSHMHDVAKKRKKRESEFEKWIAVAFSPHISPSAELSGLHILSWMKGELSLCITMTFRPHSFSHCLTVFGQQMHPHRGVAAPSLHPQSQHADPYNSPNKRERGVGPSCANCSPWIFWGTLGKCPVRLNDIRERAAAEFPSELLPKAFKSSCWVWTLSPPDRPPLQQVKLRSPLRIYQRHPRATAVFQTAKLAQTAEWNCWDSDHTEIKRRDSNITCYLISSRSVGV